MRVRHVSPVELHAVCGLFRGSTRRTRRVRAPPKPQATFTTPLTRCHLSKHRRYPTHPDALPHHASSTYRDLSLCRGLCPCAYISSISSSSFSLVFQVANSCSHGVREFIASAKGGPWSAKGENRRGRGEEGGWMGAY